MNPKTALQASISGTVFVALCCFTPILVVVFGAVGLSAWVGYLDFVLLPALGVMVGLSIVSYFRYRRYCYQESGKQGEDLR
ncbi:mercury resistance system transport protein MerF [Synechococcus sp. PCC 7336]|uniref:mercury resistance system transport protein MerF n=1 Tax=Synechococcus sp. PCC 7336 TaxID=195250 RepID=UPI0003488FD5|nr:mercury resistance system transport protein MerF [Synechococcus sp. PCC 7336]